MSKKRKKRQKKRSSAPKTRTTAANESEANVEPPSETAPPSPVSDVLDLELGGDEDSELRSTSDARLSDFDVTPRVARLDRETPPTPFETDKVLPAAKEEDEENEEEEDDEEAGGMVDFLSEVPTPKKTKPQQRGRHDFLPEDRLSKPQYMPEALPTDDLEPSASLEQTDVWGKQQVDTPSFTKFDENAAIKEDIRSLPVLGKTILSPGLVFRGRLWRLTFLGAGVIAFGLGLFTIRTWIRDYRESGVQPIPEEELGLYEPALITDVDALLERYFSTTSLEERLPLVRAARHVRPLMEAYEAVHGHPYTGYRRQGNVVAPAPIMGDAYFQVDAILEPMLDHRRLIVQRRDDGGYLLDWEILVGYQEQSWEHFIAEGSTEPKTFRAVLLPSDYYNFHFHKASQWASWRIKHPVYPELLLYGYTPRKGSLTARFTRDMVMPTNGREIGTAATLKVAFPEGDDRSNNQVEIVELVREGWITPYPESE